MRAISPRVKEKSTSVKVEKVKEYIYLNDELLENKRSTIHLDEIGLTLKPKSIEEGSRKNEG